MGIKLLNNLIQKTCHKNKLISLFELKGKKIVIDVSIYLYRFKSEQKLMENMYLLCGLFQYYNIIPLFIFDGKPPDMKHNELKIRQKKKEIARVKYMKLNSYEIKSKYAKKLKRTFTRVNKTDIENVKKLIQNFGMMYVTSEGEADELCAKMVISNKAYACLSEDTDLFVYGCPVVLRYFSIINHTIIKYELKNILKTLDFTLDKFKKICILSGTDYSSDSLNIYQCIRKFKKKNINLNIEETKIYDLYNLINIKLPPNFEIFKNDINLNAIKEQMKSFNFIFT